MRIGSWLLAAFVVAMAPLNQRVPPKDEGASDPSFVAFRTKLVAAAEACDQAVLWSLVADDFGGIEGVRSLKEARTYFESQRRDQQTPTLPVCRELARALRLGTAAEPQHAYCAPYALCAWAWGAGPGEGVAAGREAVVRRQPHESAAAVDTLSYEVIEVCRYTVRDGPCEGVPDSTEGWFAVVSPRGKVGYLKWEDLLIPSGNYQFKFAYRSAGWRVIGIYTFE